MDLSPLVVKKVVAERNLLRQQVREAAAQMVRTQRLWEIELGLARNAPVVELAAGLVEKVVQAREALVKLSAHDNRAAEQAEIKQKEKERAIREAHQSQMLEAKQQHERQVAGVREALQESREATAKVKEHVALLQKECESVRQKAKADLEFHLEQNTRQCETKAAIDLAEAKERLREEIDARRLTDLVDQEQRLRLENEQALKMERAKSEMALESLRVELTQQAESERLAAVEEVKQYFKRSRVAGLSQTRAALEAHHMHESRTMAERILEQEQQIQMLRSGSVGGTQPLSFEGS